VLYRFIGAVGLNGIEASLRITLAELNQDQSGDLELPNHDTLSNKLIRKARDAGMPFEAFAFPDESDFFLMLDTKTYVRLVQLRHNVCHGNISAFIYKFDGESIFVPECLRATAATLLGISYDSMSLN
jgi:hypothetical protein